MFVVLAVVAALIIVPIFIYRTDKTYRYERSIDIDVPAETLFAFVVDMANWEKFYPNTLVARYNNDEEIALGSRSIEKYWGISGYHVFHHEVTAISKPTLIEWTGKTVFGGFLVQLFLPAAREIRGVFTYDFAPLNEGRSVRWTRTCAFRLETDSMFHKLFYIFYMPVFRFELMRALKLYQESCKEELEGRNS